MRGTTPSGRQWLAVLESKHIYSYKYGADESLLLSPLIYIFDKDGVHLAGIIAGERAVVVNNGAVTVIEAAVLSIGEGLLKQKGCPAVPVDTGSDRLTTTQSLHCGEPSTHK